MKSIVRPIKVPIPNNTNQDKKENQINLPKGWKINEINEILNEEGLIMMDIQEEITNEEFNNNKNNKINKNQTISYYEINENKNKLPNHISKILDELELEEKEIEKLNKKNQFNLTPEILITPTDLKDEINKTLNSITIKSKKEEESVKNWGKTGLEGLKNIFVSSSKINSKESKSNNEKLNNNNLKTKKSVRFTPETFSNESSRNSEIKNKSVPSPGIILSDIIENPINFSNSITSSSCKLNSNNSKKLNQVNGKNAHLNSRFASLLPRSLQNPIKKSINEFKSNEIDISIEQEESIKLTQQEEDDNDDDDDSSRWSYEDDEEEDEGVESWPPKDLDIQTVLDLRQAALEYHSKRQGLGLGKGTGSLGGDGIPSLEQEESEWVPMDTKIQAPGIPKEKFNGISKFKLGRNLNLIKNKNTEIKIIKEEEKKNKNLEFNDLSSELTSEEMKLLISRINYLGMDEESRMNAEKAASELMKCMEKVRLGYTNQEETPPKVKTGLKKIKNLNLKN